jgi:hypothetical protein
MVYPASRLYCGLNHLFLSPDAHRSPWQTLHANSCWPGERYSIHRFPSLIHRHPPDVAGA